MQIRWQHASLDVEFEIIRGFRFRHSASVSHGEDEASVAGSKQADWNGTGDAAKISPLSAANPYKLANG